MDEEHITNELTFSDFVGIDFTDTLVRKILRIKPSLKSQSNKVAVRQTFANDTRNWKLSFCKRFFHLHKVFKWGIKKAISLESLTLRVYSF